MTIINVKDLTKNVGYGEFTTPILHKINLEIEQGDFIAIIGASGSGKSTLMNILGCLDTASSGSYHIAGQETQQLTSDQLAQLRQQRFGFIFQRYNLLPHLIALDNVALPAIYAGRDLTSRQQRAAQLLTKLGLGDKLQHKPHQLSGGQQQRVSIARALMNGGDIILADEPTGALDSHSGKIVMDILQELHQEGHTLILVTHDPKIAAHAQRIIEIKDGEIIRDERQADFINNVEKPFNTHQKPRFIDQFYESFKMAINAISAHKMRAILTMLGIIIGIASVISVVALGKGSQQQILSNINGLGTNTLDIFNGKGFGDRRAGLVKNLSISDVHLLNQQPYVSAATPNSNQSGTLLFRNINVAAQIRGVGAQYFNARGLHLIAGRLFTEDEVNNAAQVIVIDRNTQKSLSLANPIGEVILVDKKPLQIIGIAEYPNSQSTNLSVWTPYVTLMQRISGAKTIDSITVKIQNGIENQIAEQSITELLTAKHGKKDFFVINSDAIKQAIESTTNTMTLLISSIALISLIVGGIGVMNIMLVSVTERTKEIGIRMAIGAKRYDILQQFLIEAVLICLLGGIIGILLAINIIWVFNYWSSHFKMVFSFTPVIAAVICSTLIGVIFGYIPARNASKLNPITALSQE